MTQFAAPPAPAVGDHGLIGNRELVCLQTIDIGRLRSAPVPITPGTFVAVSGRGPKSDSNGSGKTTFLAAVSLLHGEVGWHLASGAPEAASLLFDGTKAGVDVQRYARADRGYVIGVFRSRGRGDAITVWLRINAAAPVVKVRAQVGIHLVEGTTASERAAAADAGWLALPKPEWGTKTYPRELYGPTPRCMAWLQARGNETPGKSLLKLSQEMLQPDQIGSALLELLGRDDVLDQDRAARAELDATTREVDELLADDATRRRQEDDELRTIAGREQARSRLARANRLWQLHFAKGVLDAVARADTARAGIRPAGDSRRGARRKLRHTAAALDALGDGASLRTEAAAAEQASAEANERQLQAHGAKVAAGVTLTEHLARIDLLRIAAATWDGVPVVDLEAQESEALGALRTASGAMAVATADRERREAELRAAETGNAGAAAEAAARLTAAGISAMPLLDEIDIEPASRGRWEPRLALYRDAVVVASVDRDDAVAAAAPGDVIVAGSSDGHTVPGGLLGAPTAALPFLSALASTPGDDRHAEHGEHVTVVGGFEHAITGREARIAAARRAAQAARDVESAANEETIRRQAAVDDIQRQIDAARAAADLRDAEAAVGSLRAQLVGLDNAETTAAEAYRRARDATRQASEAWGGYRERRRRLEEAREHDEAELSRATSALRSVIEGWLRQRDRVPYWSQRWGDDYDSAARALAADAADHPSGDDRSSSAAYRRAANHAIDRALLSCGIDSTTGEGAPAGSGVDLAVRDRATAGASADDDDGGQSYERQATAFHAVADAFGAWLDRLHVEDQASAGHIAADRERRSTALAAAQDLCEERRRNLPLLQDQIERLLRTSLTAVSDKLNELDLAAKGAGADLLIEPQRPATAKENWLWRVTPRYRRGPNGALVPYTERANTATEKLLAINLVLAALFAATAARGSDNGRLLILDELGDSLGDYHREAVLQALAGTARDAGITVLGTCQDGVLEDAARHCGLLLYFQFRDPSDVLNAPTRVFGTTHDGSLVEKTAPFIARLT